MKNKLQLLLHPVFILSLACLLLNDFYWKYEYHNWFTGKLSDLTGLFVLISFSCSILYRYTLLVYAGIYDLFYLVEISLEPTHD
jgi:TRAP-type mannitol/chloroaromatic compound transport system permease small subunit